MGGPRGAKWFRYNQHLMCSRNNLSASTHTYIFFILCNIGMYINTCIDVHMYISQQANAFHFASLLHRYVRLLYRTFVYFLFIPFSIAYVGVLHATCCATFLLVGAASCNLLQIRVQTYICDNYIQTYIHIYIHAYMCMLQVKVKWSAAVRKMCFQVKVGTSIMKIVENGRNQKVSKIKSHFKCQRMWQRMFGCVCECVHSHNVWRQQCEYGCGAELLLHLLLT